MPAAQHGTVIKRDAKRYDARWFDADGKRRSRRFATKTAARQFLKTKVDEVEKERAGLVAPDRPASIDGLVDLFLERHGRTVDPATERKLRTQLKHVRDTFGKRKPETLRKAEIEDWRLDLPEGSRHDVFRAFRQVLAWASDPDRGLLERDPSRGIRNPKRKRHERRDVYPFESWEEVEAVAVELDARYRAIPVVAVGTGLRPEELFGLHRADVDRDRMRLHVRRRFTGGQVKQGTKTGSGRFVPFGQKVLAALDAMSPRIDTPVLFPAPRGGHIDIERFRYREWAPALRAAGIPHRRIYDLRHTYASWALAQDVPPAKLALLMGTSIGQLEDTYHRFLQADEERYGAALDSYGSGVRSGV